MANIFDLGSTNVALALDCPFPANVNSGPGIEVDKSGGTWTLSLSYPPLVENLVPVPGNLYLAAYGTVSGLYQKVRADNLIAAATGLDTRQPIVDANYNVTINDRYVGLAMALTAPRILTLPPANSVPGGREVVFEDEVGGLSSVNPFTAQPTGTDTINGGASYVMATPYGGARFRSNGTNSWSVVNTSNFYLVPAGQTAYTASPDGNVIAWPAFTAPVVTTLPAAAAYPKGRRLTVADRNGSCTPTNTMAVHPAGSDTINGSAAPAIATMNAPYSTITLASDGVSAWTVLGGGNLTAAASITSAQISDASTLGRQLLTNTTAALDRTALGSGAVGDSVFTSATQGTAQTALGLGTMATQAANGVSITGGTIAGVAISGGTNTNSTITTPTVNSPTISGGTANNMVIGATTPAAASVTSMNGGQLAGQRNLIINGNGRIDQRNNNAAVVPAAAGTAAYFGDRWAYSISQGSKLNYGSGLAIGGTVGQGLNTYIVGSTQSVYTPAAADVFLLFQNIEGLNSARLGWGSPAAQPATLSFWVSVSIAGTYCVSITNSGATRCYLATFNVPTASAWTYVSITIPGDTAGTWATNNTIGVSVRFNLGAGSNFIGTAGVWGSANVVATAGSVQVVANSGAGIYLTGVQLEAGPVATPFEWRLMATEMLNCMRYYERIGPVVRFNAAGGSSLQSNAISFVPKRALPTLNLVTTGARNNMLSLSVVLAGTNSAARVEIQSAAAGDCYAISDVWEAVAEL